MQWLSRSAPQHPKNAKIKTQAPTTDNTIAGVVSRPWVTSSRLWPLETAVTTPTAKIPRPASCKTKIFVIYSFIVYHNNY